MTENISF